MSWAACYVTAGILAAGAIGALIVAWLYGDASWRSER